MTRPPVLTTLTLTATATAVAGGILAAAPASAGGIGDFLSPAFGTSCANHNARSQANGATTAGTGTADGNLLGLPLGSPLNQCGGADLPDAQGAQSGLANLHGVPIGVLGSAE
ncbi:hypothetical protein [Streptomyces sp. NRRL S-920]|uniref:hypothetical protein n=1 Tax=Streptomyces sp. NRRL S-920 TaxID=1463921 RepID=UPI000561A5F9|nr:hypothetical protein [Streptomyces sp. NRRL S-920]